MDTTETMRMPALGKIAEPCLGCGALLADDQRYCLECGQRRAGPRVDYGRYLASAGDDVPSSPAPVESGPAPSPPVEPTPRPTGPERDFAPLAAVGGIAVLGLMLLVGVLIGRGGGEATTAPPPPQVITVGGTAGGETASVGADGSSPSSTSSERTAGRAKGKRATGAKAVAGGLTGEAARQSEATVQASEGDLEALNEQSGDAYQDTVKKLPDKIATPGAPPPIDKSKAPGGGGGAVTIE
jgi:hypothetical protein